MEILQTITTADWINIFIACVTLLTAIIALLTINEMRTQRVHSYFPDVNMADFSFYVYRGDYNQQTETFSFILSKIEKKRIQVFQDLMSLKSVLIISVLESRKMLSGIGILILKMLRRLYAETQM